MRTILFLLLAPVALAQDNFPSHEKVFDDARAITLDPGAQARVYPAIDALVETGDLRAVRPLASYVVETIELESRMMRDSQDTQQEAAKLHKRIQTLDKELELLRLKEKAGDQAIGPEIEKRIDEQAQKKRVFERLRKKVEGFDRKVLFLRELRSAIADGCGRLLAGMKDGDAVAALAALQEVLDVADREQALFLVRIIAGSDLPEAEESLLGILAHPKADAAVRLRVQYALAPRLTRKGAETLLKLWEQDPEGTGKHAQHALGLAAHRRFTKPKEARGWIDGLEK